MYTYSIYYLTNTIIHHLTDHNYGFMINMGLCVL